MDKERPLFILAGNGPYENRGCEAIVRGTTKILREYFRDPRFVCLSHFDSDNQYRKQCQAETDPNIVHQAVNKLRKREVIRRFWKPSTWTHLYQRYFNPDVLKYWTYEKIYPHLDEAKAVLSIGGDNYGIASKYPTIFTNLDDVVLEKRKKLVLWGASVGPFNAIPEFELSMSSHLKSVSGIFARESSTIEYLKTIGVVNNVYPVADPAFLLDPIKPPHIEDKVPIETGAIGLNLSPLMGYYVTGGDQKKWTQIAAKIITDVMKKTEMPVYLIPHVIISGSNDYEFMQNAVSLMEDKFKKSVTIVPAFSAAEQKWIISQMDIFAGARTHSTIAALSTGVPTLSLAYSIKALGINRDIFGDESYVLRSDNLNALSVAERVISISENATTIRRLLDDKIPDMRNLALRAGEHLQMLIDI
ncbi:polysaccharide pyruvyl transferase family protein [Methanosarcina mazei]|uniref:Polysaccharide pyruvyl transferase n=1 Tax=Methanosarcina mazei TaxID=2209 RepID=A0A0F8M482_METMZ|nr:polysaccharide pyruvyl transferase family protein [Methanosarcina mazei]KKH33453.1 polysaccharide pyruvyl transferase [Methanosarcina mazei]